MLQRSRRTQQLPQTPSRDPSIPRRQVLLVHVVELNQLLQPLPVIGTDQEHCPMLL